MAQICFELENIEVTFLDKEIVKIDRLAVHQFDRIGIVGRNGSGKSTILKLLTGKIKPAKGKIAAYVESGYFEQVEPPTQSDIEIDPSLIGKLHIPNDSEQLSGGEQTRLKLANLFTNYYEALLIDEPTTHLDQDGIAFLHDELQYYYGALVLISHDRALLDKLVTTIWEIRDGEVHVYTGNYSDYCAQKQLEKEQQNQAHEQYVREKKRLEKSAQDKMMKAEKIAQAGNMSKKEKKAKPNRMTETKSKGTSEKMVRKAAKAIEQRIERLQEVEVVQEERPIVFRQSKALELYNKFPIMADGFTLHAEKKILLKETRFQFPVGKTIAITGANGSGKSTLLQYIAERGEKLSISPKARMGYFQQMSYQFAKNESVLQFIQNRSSQYDEGLLRSVLHLMQFTGTDIQKNVQSLSGGEAIRLQLCQLFLGEYNILLLDEPTNFLDIQAIQALEQFIKAYEGTILLISHDQTFLNNTTDVTYEIQGQSLTALTL